MFVLFRVFRGWLFLPVTLVTNQGRTIHELHEITRSSKQGPPVLSTGQQPVQFLKLRPL